MKKLWLTFFELLKVNGDKVFVFILSLTPWLWFKDGFIILPNESYIPLDFNGDFSDFSHTWVSRFSLGEQSRYFVKLPFLLLGHLMKKLGASWILTEKIYFVAISLLASFSMYYLCSVLLNEEKIQKHFRKVACLISSIFYLFNVYVIYLWGHVEMVLAYAALPLLVGLYFKGANETKGRFKYAFLFALSSQLLVLTMLNPPFYASNLIVLLMGFIYLFITKGKSRLWPFIKYSAVCLILFLFLNAWWVLPFADFILNSKQETAIGFISIASQNSSILNLFRLMGHWAWSNGSESFPYIEVYFSKLFIIIGYALTLVAFLALLTKRKILLFCLSGILLSMFLAKGSHWPMSASYLWLLNHFPGFWLFRNPYQKFTNITALFLALLLGLGTMVLYRFLIKKKNQFLGLIFIFFNAGMILLHAFPLVNGEVMFYQSDNTNSPQVKIPGYWYEAAHWLNRQPDEGRILLLPENIGYIVPYYWNYYGRDVAEYLFHQPYIEPLGKEEFTRNEKTFVSLVHNTLYLPLYFKPEAFNNILGYFNIRWIVQRNDYNFELAGSLQGSPALVKEALSNTSLNYVQSFGEIDIYEVPSKSKFYLPRIYLPQKIYIFKDGVEETLEIVSAKDFINQSALVNLDELPKETQEAMESLNSQEEKPIPQIEFKRLDNTYYKVKVTDSRGPFLLVFSENYHPRWQAKIDGKTLGKAQHFQVNNYANGWLIDNKGNFEISIEFLTQKFFYCGLAISTLTVLIGIGYLFYEMFYENRRP